MTPDTTGQDLYGKQYPNMDSSSNQKFVLKEGPVTKTVKNGQLLILVGVNNLEGNILESLNPILESGKDKILVVNDAPIRISNETMVIATASMRSLKSG